MMIDRQRQAGDDVSVFLAVCDAGGFAAAAPRVGLTPSAVAKAIARLEGRLNVRLFHRTTRRLALTAEAAIYRAACQAARDRIDRVEADLAALAAQPAGTVRVSLPPLMGAHIVAPALYALCETWPHLNFDISASTAWTDLPGEGVDLAVRIGELPDLPDLTARRLGTQRVVLCATPGYLAGRSPVHEVKDLAGHRLIANARDGRPMPWHFRSADGDRLTFHPDSRLLLDGGMLTLSAIRAGQGLGIVPYWMVHDEIVGGALVALLDDSIGGHMPVHALWITSPVMPPRLRVTIDAIARTVRTAAHQDVLT